MRYLSFKIHIRSQIPAFFTSLSNVDHPVPIGIHWYIYLPQFWPSESHCADDVPSSRKTHENEPGFIQWHRFRISTVLPEHRNNSTSLTCQRHSDSSRARNEDTILSFWWSRSGTYYILQTFQCQYGGGITSKIRQICIYWWAYRKFFNKPIWTLSLLPHG